MFLWVQRICGSGCTGYIVLVCTGCARVVAQYMCGGVHRICGGCHTKYMVVVARDIWEWLQYN